MQISSSRIDKWRIFFASILFFAPFLGGVHLFDWDEINFAELAREMVISGSWLSPQLGFQPFTEKPPLFFWMQALSMEAFGIGEYAARFPNVLAGLVTLWIIYDIGFRLHGQRLARWWVLAYFGSTLPHMYFKSGLIDPWFNFFIFGGLWFLIKYHWRKNEFKGSYLKHPPSTYLVIAALFTGLGILTKGPVAYLIIGLSLFVYWILGRFRFFIKPIPFILYTLMALLVTGIWYGLETAFNGPDFIVEFTKRQWALLTTPDAGHGGFPAYHFVVLLIGVFPASAFALQGLLKKHGDVGVQKDMRIWMTILLLVVLVLFSLVKSKIVHYSSLAYFPLSYLAAFTLERLSNGNWSLHISVRILLAFLAFLYFVACTGLVLAGQNAEIVQGWLAADPFAMNNLNAQVSWPLITWLPALVILLVQLVFQLLYNKQRTRSLNWLFIGHALWVQLALVTFIARIEGFSQRAHIEFFKSMSEEDAWLGTYRFKSYVPYFYGELMPADDNRGAVWHAQRPRNKPAYISVKEGQQQRFLRAYPDAVPLYSKNGFHFFKLRADPSVAAP